MAMRFCLITYIILCNVIAFLVVIIIEYPPHLSQCPSVQEPKKPLDHVFKVVTMLFSVSYEILVKKFKRKPEALYI